MGLGILREMWRSNDQTKGATRSVLNVLCIHASEDERRSAWPSLLTIARAAGVTRATAFKAVKELERGGQIVKVGQVPIRRMMGSKDRALKQYVNEYRIGVFLTHTPSEG